MFVISKTLREYYKDQKSVAHKVLADRMAERDLVINLLVMNVYRMSILKLMNNQE